MAKKVSNRRTPRKKEALRHEVVNQLSKCAQVIKASFDESNLLRPDPEGELVVKNGDDISRLTLDEASQQDQLPFASLLMIQSMLGNKNSRAFLDQGPAFVMGFLAGTFVSIPTVADQQEKIEDTKLKRRHTRLGKGKLADVDDVILELSIARHAGERAWLRGVTGDMMQHTGKTICRKTVSDDIGKRGLKKPSISFRGNK